jgi:hypothetical protein
MHASRLASLLHLLVVLLSTGTVGQSKRSREVSRSEKETGFLSSKNTRDVTEFQRRLHKADLDFARDLLELFDGVRELKNGSDDPKKVAEQRTELETMVKGEYREGRGWIWNGHIVPEPESRRDFFERRKRIIRNGVWNPSRKGWEYQGEFFGVWEH